jgi:cytochrome c oxidase subunit 2
MLQVTKLFISNCDSAEHWQFGFQDPATPVMEGMIYFHNYLAFFLILICAVVFWMLYVIIKNFDYTIHSVSDRFTHSNILEIVWTLIPAFLLLLIAVPSFALLYSLDELVDPSLTLKVVGHQWYWSYEYSDYETLEGGSTLNFDSYMVPESDLVKGSFRLLEVDQYSY